MSDSQLFVEERHARIVEHLEANRKASVGELCEVFSVSGATMRNDLRALENAGLITRTHGGAMRRTRTGLELDSLAKEVRNQDAKRTIARRALQLVHDGDTIVLDTGTTTLELARLLHDRRELTVVTNDLAIALALEEVPDLTIVFLGGVVRKRFHCTVAHAEQSDPVLGTLSVDTAFMGTNSFSVEHGASTPDLGTAHVKRRMMAIASSVVLLCDATKFEAESFARFATTREIDVLVADRLPDASAARELREQNVDLICDDEPYAGTAAVTGTKEFS
ncbi:MAG: DeoR/GlpR family DNA-binding transcription regulator [Spirochaetota bacterium]